MVFDSCFSGTVFASLKSAPTDISEKSTRAVRQFITAGSDEEQVPDESVFKICFIQGIKGEADFNKDGYVTGSELGMHLDSSVVNYSMGSQHPQYGKIRNPELDKGDFIFVASGGTAIDEPGPLPTATGTLRVSADVSEARVYIDGSDRGGVPATLTLDPKTYRVEVKKSGYDSWRTNVTIEAGRTASLMAYLTPEKPKMARLFVNPTPSKARIRILNIGPVYERGMELEPGSYHVEVSKDGYEKEKRWVQLAAGEDKYESFTLGKIRSQVAKKSSSVTWEEILSDPHFHNASPEIQKRIARDFFQDHIGSDTDYQKADPELQKRIFDDFMATLPKGKESDSISKKNSSFTNSIGMKFVRIPAGTFIMGSPSSENNRDNDETQHRVTLTKPFYMQTTEVTQGHWRAVMGNNPSRFSNCGDNCPVEQVSWNNCQEFIRKLNQREGTNKYRLPTEAEWEYACRAGTTGPYYADLDRAGWYDGNSGDRTHPVGQKEPNNWGLFDMHGNVYEWCQDCYGGYPGGSVTDPKGPSSGQYRVVRGGGGGSDARHCRSAIRGSDAPDNRSNSGGFRVAWTK